MTTRSSVCRLLLNWMWKCALYAQTILTLTTHTHTRYTHSHTPHTHARAGAENSFNLFTVRKNTEAASEVDQQRLQTTGQFHLGEFVNRFRRGSLVMQPPTDNAKRCVYVCDWCVW